MLQLYVSKPPSNHGNGKRRGLAFVLTYVYRRFQAIAPTSTAHPVLIHNPEPQATSQDTCPKTALIAKNPLASVVAKRATLDAIALLLPRAVLQEVVHVIDVDSPAISRATAHPMLVDSPTTAVIPAGVEALEALEAASATSADV